MEPVNKRNYDTQQRRALAEQGKALPDGSFPIVDRADLANALQAIGRAGNRKMAEEHIRRRAKDLDALDMLPDWAMAKAKVTPLSNALSTLLADSYSVYHDAHGYHWNVKGMDFAQYHELFAEIAGDIYGSIDDIAENMLKIEADAPFRMSELSQMRTIAEGKPDNSPQQMATELLREIDGLITTLKRTFDVATAENEQGIADFIAGRIDMTQKWAWQLRSSIGVQKSTLAKSDEQVLDAMHQVLSLFMSEDEIAILRAEVEKANGIVNTTGVARDHLEKAAAIMAGAVATRSFGGNRSAAASYAARVRWGSGSGSSGSMGQKTTSPVGAAGWQQVDAAGSKAMNDIDATLGSGHPEHQRVADAIGLLKMSRRADKGGEGEVLPDAASRAHRDAGTAGMMLTLASRVKGVPESVGRLATMVNDIAAKLKARAEEARKS